MTTYHEVREENNRELSNLPIFFAFNEKQFQEGKETLGVTEDSELCKVSAAGIMKKEDAHLFSKWVRDCEERMNAFLATDEGMVDAIRYELSNHEYCITRDPEGALSSLGLSLNDERVQRLFPVARKIYLDECEE